MIMIELRRTNSYPIPMIFPVGLGRDSKCHGYRVRVVSLDNDIFGANVFEFGGSS